MVAQRIDSKCRIHAALQSGFDCKQIVVILDLTRQCKIVAASASVKIFDGKLCKLIRLDSRPEFIRSGSAAAEGSEPCKVIQRLAHGRMVRRYCAAGKTRKGTMLTAGSETCIVAGFRIGRILRFHRRHEIVSQFLGKGVSQGIQTVFAVIFHIESRGDNDKRFNYLLLNHLIQHGFVLRMRQKPVVFIVAGAVHQV